MPITQEQADRAYQAYRIPLGEEGSMKPEHRSRYETDVAENRVPLPEGVESLKETVSLVTAKPFVAPLGATEAFLEGEMAQADSMKLAGQIEEGKVILNPEYEARQELVESVSFWRNLPGAIKESATGEKRRVPETEALQDWLALPELDALSGEGFKTLLATAATGPEETAKIIKEQFPDVQISQDEKGNYIYESAINKQKYAFKPGFRLSDIPRAGAITALFGTGAGAARTIGGQIFGAAGLETLLQTSQAAAGGKIDPKAVGYAALGAGAGAVLSRVGGATIGALRGKGRFGEAAKLLPEEDLGNIAQITAKAAKGDVRAAEKLAAKVAPDPEMVKAARLFDIEEDIALEALTTDPSVREVFRGVSDVIGSKTAAIREASGAKIVKQFDDELRKLGAVEDLAGMSADTKQGLKRVTELLDNEAQGRYDDLAKAVGKGERNETPNIIKFLKEKGEDLGGFEELSSKEKELFFSFSPKKEGQPTYALLDERRKDLNDAIFSKTGPFKDMGRGKLQQLSNALLKDQQAIAAKYGDDVLKIFDEARDFVKTRKGVEDGLVDLFGSDILGSISESVGTATQKLKIGSTGSFEKIVKGIQNLPKTQRQEIVASGLNKAFGKMAANGQMSFNTYANWYEGLKRNKTAMNALMVNLPKGAPEKLKNMYILANGLRKASTKAVKTGKGRELSEMMKGTEGAMTKIYGMAKKGVPIAAGEAALGIAGLPGGYAIVGAIGRAIGKGKKPDIMAAADDLISSASFRNMAMNPTKFNANRFAKSSAWKKYVKEIGSPQELKRPMKWIMRAFKGAVTGAAVQLSREE